MRLFPTDVEDAFSELRVYGVLRSSAHKRRLYSLETLIPLKYASHVRSLERNTEAPELQRLRERKEA